MHGNILSPRKTKQATKKRVAIEEIQVCKLVAWELRDIVGVNRLPFLH
jgi:hypothetical protein